MTQQSTLPIYAGPEALKSTLMLSYNREASRPDMQPRLYVDVDPQRLAGMAQEIDTPLHFDDLAIVLSAGKRLSGCKQDVEFKKAPPEHLYTPLSPTFETPKPSEAVPKKSLQDRRVLELTVNKWDNDYLGSEAARSLQEPELAIARRNRLIRIGGSILGGVGAPGGYAAANPNVVSAAIAGVFMLATGIYTATELGVGLRKDSKAYDRGRVAARRHDPFKVVRKYP